MKKLWKRFDMWYRKKEAEEILFWEEGDRDFDEILETETQGFIQDHIKAFRRGINEGKKRGKRRGSRYGRIGKMIGSFLGAGGYLGMHLMPVWVTVIIIWMACTEMQW